jgi:hypothetical protein
MEDSVDHEMVRLCLTYSASVQRSKRNEMAQLLVKAGRNFGLQIGYSFWTALGNGKSAD